MRRNKEIKISLTEEEMERIEKIAKKIGITKSRLARNLVIASLEDIEILEKLGFIEIVKLLKKIKDKALKEKDLKLIHN
jgi:predicted DNA-binding protein